MQPSEISERILSLLDKPGYVILEKTGETIKFMHNIWRIGSRMEAYGRVDGGRFEIIAEGKELVVKFDYYVSLVFWILFIVFLTFLGLTKEIHILYLIPAFLIFFCFHVWNVRSTAKEMMKCILKVT